MRNFRELQEDLNAVGERLHEAGLNEDAVVAVLAPQGTLQVISTIGALAYCVCVPMQPRTTLTEVQEALERFRASAIIVAPQFFAEAEMALGAGIVVIRADERVSPRLWPIEEPRVRSIRPCALPPGTALLMSTSATTDRAKIVPLSSENINASVLARNELLQLADLDRFLLLTSLFHVLGIQNTLAQWLAGGAVIVLGGFETAQCLRMMIELRPTWYNCSPTIHQAILTELEKTSAPQSTSLRFVQSAGAPLPPVVRARLEALLGVPVWNDYGMTEACPIACDADMKGSRVEGSAGRSCYLEIGILNDSGQLLSPGESGEIVVRGPGVFAGYLDDPEANRTAFYGDWFRTGDAGRIDDQGNLFITGRLKEMINRGGEKISPAEVDAAIAVHPAVLEVATFAMPHPTLSEVVACAVVLRPGLQHVTPTDLRRFVGGRLGAFKVPQRIVFVDSIPRGELGKPQRWKLAEQFSVPQTPETIGANREFQLLPAASRDVFFKIREIWVKILGRNDLAIEENFFDAGGDSLSAMNMLAEVDEFFQTEVSKHAADFLDEPTLFRATELVGQPPGLEQAPDPANAMSVHLVGSCQAPVRIYCAPAEQEDGLYFRGLARHLAGRVEVAIVRRPHAAGKQRMHVFEQDGEDMASAIREMQPQGPYVLGGYCYGAMIAAEAVRYIASQGESVRLVLFDAPLPGVPGFLCTTFLLTTGLLRQRRSALSSEHNSFDVVRVLLRRPLWNLISRFSDTFDRLAHFSLVQLLIRSAQKGNFPYYRPRQLSVPVMHFVCENETDKLVRISREGWRSVATAGIREVSVGLDHHNLFHESNLPEMVRALCGWLNDISTSSGEKI
ncbi:MAG: alpha/beta fold hydrolase [Terracidiphilus sp.]|nr:alpha/beta fold hydrolase [Terracidiphilus sp.]